MGKGSCPRIGRLARLQSRETAEFSCYRIKWSCSTCWRMGTLLSYPSRCGPLVLKDLPQFSNRASFPLHKLRLLLSKLAAVSHFGSLTALHLGRQSLPPASASSWLHSLHPPRDSPINRKGFLWRFVEIIII